LACLAGLDDPDGGFVRIAGERVSRRPEVCRAALRARHVGMLFQQANLFEHLSVRGNLLLAQRLSGHKDPKEVDDLLAAVGMAARAASRPSRLSGWEVVRAGLAVAMLGEPAVLLADEPTGELDGDTEAAVLALLADRADRGAAVLMASHSQAVTGRADRLLALRAGQVAA
jgi:putative ABC transport system ATP-binding protein